MARNLSPKKTWEGYFGGLAGATLGGLAVGWLFQVAKLSGGAINPAHGLVLGFLIGLLSPLGDLTISLMKREGAQKDSGDFFPGPVEFWTGWIPGSLWRWSAITSSTR
jgi:phosphatidate cytidylyltransferase